MSNHGLHHLGLATHNMEATLEFYEGVLGFPLRVADVIEPEAGGTIRHAFLDTGQGEMIAFMECNDVPGIDPGFDAGINAGLGIKGGMIHFAFGVEDEEGLVARQSALRSKSVDVTEIVDHGWCKSIYFHDPNGLHLEFCTTTATLDNANLEDLDSAAWRRWSRS